MAALEKSTGRSVLGRFIDQLLQTFEDRRGGLGDDDLKAGPDAVLAYFLEIYEGERERLKATLLEWQIQLDAPAQEKLFGEVDRLLRSSIIPAYARLTAGFTPKERRDFYHLRESLRLLERITWGLGGILVGVFVIVAPFIPIWSKEWVLPFMIAGLLFPELRRFISLRRYERELNRMVDQGERELLRLDRAYLENGPLIPELAEIEQEASAARRAQQHLAGQSKKEG